MTQQSSTRSLHLACSVDPSRLSLSVPFPVTLDGAKWAVATDGRLMVAARGAEWPAPDPAHSPPDATVVIKSALEQPVIGTVDDVALRAWCGINPAREDCGGCDGVGSTLCTCQCGHDHDAECPECLGLGVHDPAGKMLARIGDRPELISYGLIARGLDALCAEPVRWTVRIGDDFKVHSFESDAGLVIVMPSKTTSFPMYVPAIPPLEVSDAA